MNNDTINCRLNQILISIQEYLEDFSLSVDRNQKIDPFTGSELVKIESSSHVAELWVKKNGGINTVNGKAIIKKNGTYAKIRVSEVLRSK